MHHKLFKDDDLVIKPKNFNEVKGHHFRMGLSASDAPLGVLAQDVLTHSGLVDEQEYTCHSCGAVLNIPETLEPYIKELVKKAGGKADTHIFWVLVHPGDVPLKR